MQICYNNSRYPYNFKMHKSLETTLGLRKPKLLYNNIFEILNLTTLKTTKYIYQNHKIIAFINDPIL